MFRSHEPRDTYDHIELEQGESRGWIIEVDVPIFDCFSKGFG